MKTVFVCDALNLRVEGLDNRPYAVNERITLKHQGRWLPMIVEEVRERGDVRQVILRINNSPDSLFLQRRLPARPSASSPRPPVDDTWIDRLCDDIEGGRGHVTW